MDTNEKMDLVLRPPTEELLVKDELRAYFDEGRSIEHYIGFEISGFIHLGTGLVAGAKIADFQKAGINCRIFLADWHAWINNKLGGDRDVIRSIASRYFKEGMAISIKLMGGDPDKVNFLLGSELYNNSSTYWENVINISKNLTLARVRKSITIMGRGQQEGVNFAQLIYPPMQVADIFDQDITLAHSGIDQRKAHVIAREVAPKINRDKPIAIHHKLLLGLTQPPVWPVEKDKLKELLSQMKMSKSVPKSAVFIHDSPEEIKDKLNKAFCPAKNVEFNPILDWAETLIFRDEKAEIEIKRPAKFGGDVTFYDYETLSKEFVQGNLHPLDLKKAVSEKIVELLEPAREKFSKPKYASMLEEIREVKITR